MSRKVDTQLPTLAKLKILILGDSKVGKTCILNKYLSPQSTDLQTKPTIGVDYKSQRRNIGDKASYIHFWDLSGDELYLEVRNEFYTEANGFILVFDMTNRDSFTKLKNWIEEAEKYKTEIRGSALLANKSDSTATAVTNEEAAAFAKQVDMRLFTVSAKTGDGIQEAFEYTLTQSIKKTA